MQVLLVPHLTLVLPPSMVVESVPPGPKVFVPGVDVELANSATGGEVAVLQALARPDTASNNDSFKAKGLSNLRLQI